MSDEFKINLNEVSPNGKSWGRCSKTELVGMIYNISGTVQRLHSLIYIRDLLYNPCHESNRITATFNKGED